MLTEMTDAQRRALHARGKEIVCRLYDVSVYLPEDYAILREMADRLYSERVSPLMCEMGFLILNLARPALPDHRAEVADRIDILFTKIEAGLVPISEIDEDDIPY